MGRKLFVLYFLLATTPVFSQITINGIVQSNVRSEAIPYANIGILNSNIGTLSNDDGTFSLIIPQRHLQDTLFISALGFERRQLPLSEVKGNTATITLKEKPIILNGVTLTAKREKNRQFELGNRASQGGVIETDTLYAGRAIALLIESNESLEKEGFSFPAYIEKASIRIFRNNLASYKFRVRLNEVDPVTGLPGGDILNQSIVKEFTRKNGWIEFDLSFLNLIISKPFFLTFEQILDLKDRTAIADGYREFIREHPEKLVTDTIYFNGTKEVRQILKGAGIDVPGTFISIATRSSAGEEHQCYVRQTSFGEWKKVRGIVTATAMLAYQPVEPVSK